MSDNFAYDLTMALIPGVAGGYYSGLLMAKQAKFNSLKHEALRCIRSVNYVGDEFQTALLTSERVNELHLIASELLHLKHLRAGECMLKIAREAETMVASCNLAQISVKKVMSQLDQFQESVRALHPGLRFLLPWGQI